MKIYNEVILNWNDETEQFETVYEDSFEYDGPVELAMPIVCCNCGMGGDLECINNCDNCEAPCDEPAQQYEGSYADSP